MREDEFLEPTGGDTFGGAAVELAHLSEDHRGIEAIGNTAGGIEEVETICAAKEEAPIAECQTSAHVKLSALEAVPGVVGGG